MSWFTRKQTIAVAYRVPCMAHEFQRSEIHPGSHDFRAEIVLPEGATVDGVEAGLRTFLEAQVKLFQETHK